MGGIKHTYTLDGAKILREQWVEGEDIKREITPLYDNEDNVCGILHCDIPYYFLKNLQGDVIAITNQRGETVARYTYDAWGACTISYDATATPAVEGGEAINIATINPFRYRSYYFDTETGLYYLQSRYYDPNLGRFINGDEEDFAVTYNIIEVNRFSYCLNDPFNNEDICGNIATFILKKIGSVLWGIFLGIASQFLSDVLLSALKRKWTFSGKGDYIISAACGAWDGLWGGGIIKEICKSLLVNILSQIVNMVKNKSKFDFLSLIMSVVDALFSYILDKIIKTPQYIRDIKKKAREKGIKGLKKLTKYLNRRIALISITKFTINAIYSAVTSFVQDAIGYVVQCAKDLFSDLKKEIGGMAFA